MDFSTGHWDDIEKEKFMQAVRQFGKDWNQIQAFVGTRSKLAIRGFAQYFK